VAFWFFSATGKELGPRGYERAKHHKWLVGNINHREKSTTGKVVGENTNHRENIISGWVGNTNHREKPQIIHYFYFQDS